MPLYCCLKTDNIKDFVVTFQALYYVYVREIIFMYKHRLLAVLTLIFVFNFFLVSSPNCIFIIGQFLCIVDVLLLLLIFLLLLLCYYRENKYSGFLCYVATMLANCCNYKGPEEGAT